MFNPLKAKLDDMRIVLATGSKQRQDILRATGLNFEVIVSNFEENLDRSKHTFSEYVQETALGKVKEVWERLKNDVVSPDVIIGLDTMVCCDGNMFGKAKDKDDATRMIKVLTNSGLPHLVYTGVVIKYKDTYEKFVEVTCVYMSPLSDEEILGYIATEEYKGKAGAYAIQGIAASFVERVNGDYNNVIGLPLCAISKKLKELLQNQ